LVDINSINPLFGGCGRESNSVFLIFFSIITIGLKTGYCSVITETFFLIKREIENRKAKTLMKVCTWGSCRAYQLGEREKQSN